MVAVFQMASDRCAIAGPLVAGWLADAASSQAAFGVTTAVLGCAVVAALALPATRAGSAGARTGA